MQASTSQPLTNGAIKALANSSPKTPTAIQQAQPSNCYQLKRLRGIHHQIIRMSAQGMKGVDIAATLDVTDVMVSYTLNSEIGRQKLAVLNGEADMSSIDVMREFSSLAPLAMEMVEDILLNTAAKDSDRLMAADKILSGAGLLKTGSVDINVHHTTDDELKEVKLKAREMGKFLAYKRKQEEEQVVDAVVVETTEANDGRTQSSEGS